MTDSVGLRFLYRTVPGRYVLKILIQPNLSSLLGRFLDSRISRVFIPYFKKSNHISMENIQIPDKGFASFNDFFCRKRSIQADYADNNKVYSPCDGFLSAFSIDEDSVFQVKNSAYSLRELLKSSKAASYYQGGTALIFRLTPAHYHRYVYMESGRVLAERSIPGVLHCVRPIATEQFPVYVQNARGYCVLETADIGKVIQMEVGALFVGRITNPSHLDEVVERGQEKGYFEFGGSTIIVLLKKDAFTLTESIADGLAESEEVPVMLGQEIGYRKQ